jgi:hypothetical protein
LLLSSAALAQVSGTATVRGTVKDPTGGVLPGATVTLTNTATRAAQTDTTDTRGGYVFSSVYPGPYELKAELQGFKTHEQRGLTISAADTRGIDVTLEVGQQTETITVTGQKEVTQTETGAREGLVTAQQIDNLSVIGRSSLELLRIMPGVVAPEPGVLESVGFLVGGNSTQGYTVNGVRSSNNVVMLDGANLIDIGSNNGVILSPNNDMVQEVKVQSSNYAAEYGSSGMQVSAITKSGTANYRGTLYDYVRDWHFAANDRSNAILGQDKAKSKFNFPGGNIGGPVTIPGTTFNRNRDKMFFFFGVEVQRQQVDSGSFLSVVPTLKQRNGDFSENLACIGQHLNQPCSVNIPGGFPGAGGAAPNGNLAPYVHPVGRLIADLYPLPNYTDPINRHNYIYRRLEPNNRVELTMRLDYNISDNTKAYLRLARQSEKREEPRGIWWPASLVELPTPNLATSLGRGATFSVVSVLGQSTTNEVLFSWARLKLDNDHKDPSKVSRAALGAPDIGWFPDQSPYVPLEIMSSGWGNGSGEFGELWSPTNNFLFAYNDTTTISDKLTKIWNSHALKFGASVEQVNKHQNFQNNENVLLAFGTWIPGSTGSELGDLLVGRPAQVQQGTRIPDGKFRLYNFDAFAQDSWKIRPNFTLEYGVRFSYMPNNAERTGLGAYFDPGFYDPRQGAFLNGDVNRLNGVRYVQYGQAEKQLTRQRDPFFLGRANFAWDITGNGNNVVRGGYGKFVNRPMGNTVYDVLRFPPNAYSTSIDAWGASDLAGGTGLTYDTIRLIDPYKRMAAGSFGVDTVNPASIRWPETHSFSVGYARRIPFDQVVEAAYVGTQGRHLVSRSQANFIPLGVLSSGVIGNADLSIPVNRVALDTSVLNKFRAFPAFNYVRWWEYKGVSHYHSMQLTLSRQTGKNLQYFATYTLSHSTGTLGSEYDDINPIDPTRTFGVLNSDRRHIFNLSYNWILPDLSPSNNVVARGVLNGWQLSGISTFASGYPIRLRFSGDINSGGISTAWFGTPDLASGAGFGAIMPLYVADPRTNAKKKNGNKIFNIGAFGIPKFGESGPTQPPYDLRSPWRWNHDLTIFKNFRVNDTQKVQFRVGFFNLFNQAFASQGDAARNDIDLTLDTRCVKHVNHVPNGAGGFNDGVCDPTGGFEFTENTIKNFGLIRLMRGHRVIEFALKYYF